MASKITRKNTLSVQGTVNITDGRIIFEVEDAASDYDLVALMSDFNGQEVKLSVNQTDDLV